MRLDLVVYDAHGKTRGYARLKLDFDRNLWSAEEDAQRAWRHAGFSGSGPFEVMDDDVIWLWEQEAGNARCNTAVLTDMPVHEADGGQTGVGRIVTGQVGRFDGGKVRWTVIEPLCSAGILKVMGPAATVAGLPTDIAA